MVYEMGGDPLYRLMIAYKAKMHRAVDGKKHHLKVARLGHLTIAKQFDRNATFFKQRLVECSNAIITNQKFSIWMDSVERCD